MKKRAINAVTFAVCVSPAAVVTLALPDNPKARLETNILLTSICNLNTLSFFMTFMRSIVCALSECESSSLRWRRKSSRKRMKKQEG